MTKTSCLAVLVLGACFALPLTAAAAEADGATRSAARRLGTNGVEAFEAGDYKTASEKLERAYSALKVPTLGLWSARALIKLNRWVEASERLVEVGRLKVESGDVETQKAAKRDAEAELAELTTHMPTIVIDLKGTPSSDVSLTIDERALPVSLIGEPIPVDPGQRVIRAKNSQVQAEALATLQPDQQGVHVLLVFNRSALPAAHAATSAMPPTAPTPKPEGTAGDAAPPSRTRRNVGLVSTGAGVVVVGLGTYFYSRAKSNNDEAKGICPMGSGCSADDVKKHTELVSSVESSRTAAYVSWGVGGAALVAGAALYFTASQPKREGERRPLRFAVAPLPEGGVWGTFGGSLQ